MMVLADQMSTESTIPTITDRTGPSTEPNTWRAPAS